MSLLGATKVNMDLSDYNIWSYWHGECRLEC